MSVSVTALLYEVDLTNGSHGPVWTNLIDDVVEASVTGDYGISGGGPIDSVAGPGSFTFQLRNDSWGVRPLGYYSPYSINCRPGWTFGLPFRFRVLYNGVYYTRFYGRIYDILPDTGPNGRRQVAVTVYDVMRDLLEADLREIDIQIDKTESEIITNILAALPMITPAALDIDSGIDIFRYALNTLGEEPRALTVIADVARSAFALVFTAGDGTFTVRNRHSRALETSVFSDVSPLDVTVPNDLSNVYNQIRVTIHPKTIDTAFTTILYALTGMVPSVQPGETLTLWGSFNDPLNAQRLISGLPRTPTIDAGTDYAGNTNEFGTGTNITADLTVVATMFAASVLFEVTNNGTVPAWLIAPSGTGPLLQVRGKGVYDRGPQTYQSYTPQPYGIRPFRMDMPYQDDPLVGQSAAEYIDYLYNGAVLSGGIGIPELTRNSQMRTWELLANESDAKMLFALTVEPGMVMTVLELVTNQNPLTKVVQRVSFRISEKIIIYTLELAPASNLTLWLWGVVGRSEWGITTVYGF